MLDKNGVIAYVGANASRFNLDPAALLAVAGTEGLNTKPGSTWVLPNEGGLPNFGPASWYTGGAGADFMKFFHVSTAAEASQIAWSPAGLDYWMQTAAADGGAGKTGLNAITALVTGFERPAQNNVAGNIIKAKDAYEGVKAQIASLLGQVPTQPGSGGGVTDTPPEGNPILTPPADSGGLTTSTGSSTTTGASGGGGGSSGTKLGSIGPFEVDIPSGLVLGLFGMGLLALGVIFFVAQGSLRSITVPANRVGRTFGQP
jgi:hypothetical protein